MPDFKAADSTVTDPSEGVVLFDFPDGSVRSNDPYYNAAKLVGNTPSNIVSADEDLPDELNVLSGKELIKLANAEGVDIKGLKKVGEVRDAIRAARGEEPAGDGDDSDDDADDDETE